DDTDKKVLETLCPIGVQITDHNFAQSEPYEEWIAKLAQLLDDVYARTGREKMLVSIDHEGGRVHRLPPPLSHFPAAAVYESQAYEVAQCMGEELRSLGINLTFSPVCDIHSNPNNPVIGDRSFHSDAKVVCDRVTDFIRGTKESGLLTCAKHFPGHGDTAVDSHLELPSVTQTEEELIARELLPFKAAIEAGVDMVMTAHIIIPHLDTKFPATLSSAILSSLLRHKLHYDGIVITDDLDMKAIADHFPETVIAQRALAAGCDILLFNHEPLRAIDVAKQLYQLLHEGKLDEALFLKSFHRIETLIGKLPDRHLPSLLTQNILSQHHALVAKFSKDQG
ncbi:MAG: glycoside hydrolase family 3 protein, partial [Bdellovibrionales bacterium]|nr:glycoside hydrolase family 3 protein [Bdellovibrionales bacterium]